MDRWPTWAAATWAIDHATAADLGITVGDSIEIGGRAFHVGYVVSDDLAIFSGASMVPDDFRGTFPDVEGPEQLAVDMASGRDMSDAESALEDIADTTTAVNVNSNKALKEEINDQLDRAIAVVVAILALAVVIAAIGMVNTLSLAVHERTREIGLLRALGVTSRGVRAMLSVESLLSSLVAGALGVTIGAVYAWAAVASIPNLVFVVPWAWLGACLVVAAILGLIASVAPARRAARLSPVAALAVDH